MRNSSLTSPTMIIADLGGRAHGVRLDGPARERSRLEQAQPEAFTSYQKPPFRLMLLPLFWPGPLSPM